MEILIILTIIFVALMLREKRRIQKIPEDPQPSLEEIAWKLKNDTKLLERKKKAYSKAKPIVEIAPEMKSEIDELEQFMNKPKS